MRLPSSAAVAAAALAVLTGLRLLLAARFPLAPDEAYYWVWSRALAPGYFDHPPMIALWIRAERAQQADPERRFACWARSARPSARCCCGTPGAGCRWSAAPD